jgi:rubrerythrin
MEQKSPFDLEDPHKKAQDAIDHAREVRELKIADRDKYKKDPRLTADGNLMRCSVCGYPFQADEKPSMSVAFARHLMKDHQPCPTSE